MGRGRWVQALSVPPSLQEGWGTQIHSFFSWSTASTHVFPNLNPVKGSGTSKSVTGIFKVQLALAMILSMLIRDRLTLFLVSVLWLGLMVRPAILLAQEPVVRCDPPAGSLSRLNKAQKATFLKSQDTLLAGRYTEALKQLRDLLEELPVESPAHLAVAERAAEAALYAGETEYAITLLKPVEKHDGSDCAARTLLARAYAENGKSAERDAELTALTTLHAQSPRVPAGQLDMFLLEEHKLDSGGAVTIWYVLRPFGAMQTHLFAEVSGRSGSELVRIELNSDDGLQVYFKEQHPELAAKGERQYSLDALALNHGKPEHATIQYYDGIPAYDTVRQKIFEIAERAAKTEK